MKDDRFKGDLNDPNHEIYFNMKENKKKAFLSIFKEIDKQEKLVKDLKGILVDLLSHPSIDPRLYDSYKNKLSKIMEGR